MSLIIEKTLQINTNTDRVWEILTNGKWTEKYTSGLCIKSDFYQDSPIEFRGIINGEEMEKKKY